MPAQRARQPEGASPLRIFKIMRGNIWRAVWAQLKHATLHAAFSGPAILALTFSVPTHAADPIPANLYQMTCLPALDLFEFRRLELWELDTRASVLNRHRRQFEKAYALYAAEWHMKFKGARPDVDSATSVEPKKFQCELSDGFVELIVRPEPRMTVFGVSVSVTLLIAGRKIVNDLPFAACNIVDPISRVTYRSADRRLEFTGEFGGLRTQPTDPTDRFADTFRTYFIEANSIRATNVEALGRAKRTLPLRDFDIDYSGSGGFLEIGRMYDDCRYHGPGSAFATEHGLSERRAK